MLIDRLHYNKEKVGSRGNCADSHGVAILEQTGLSIASLHFCPSSLDRAILVGARLISPLSPTLFFIRRENSVNRGTTDGTLAL